jgi:cell division septation protein DedD
MTAKNLRQFEFKLGKLGVVLFMVGLAILVFAGFLLGVQVGRNIDTYPDMIARGIPGQILQSIGLSAPVMKPEITAGGEGMEKKDTAGGEKPADAAAGGENAAAVMSAPAPAAPTAEAENKGAPAAPAAAPDSSVGASPAPPQGITAETGSKETTVRNERKNENHAATEKAKAPPERNGRFTIQVVSFREKEKANGLSRKIKDLGYAPKVSMVDVSGKGQWYRVTVNGFATRQEAEKTVDELTRKIKGLSCVIKGK